MASSVREAAAGFEVEIAADDFSDLFITKLLQDLRRKEANGVETRVSKSLPLERAEGDQLTSPASLRLAKLEEALVKTGNLRNVPR